MKHYRTATSRIWPIDKDTEHNIEFYCNIKSFSEWAALIVEWYATLASSVVGIAVIFSETNLFENSWNVALAACCGPAPSIYYTGEIEISP